MIETPNTSWKPAANTASHISGRTNADNSRPRCCTNLMISRAVTARSARPTWANCMARYRLIWFGSERASCTACSLPPCGLGRGASFNKHGVSGTPTPDPSPQGGGEERVESPRVKSMAVLILLVQMARGVGLVVAERVELIGTMQEAFDGSACHHLVRRRQQHRLPHLMIPWADPDREPLVAIEGGIAHDELLLLGEIDRAGAQRRLHDHLDCDPGGPVGAFHPVAGRAPFKAVIHLRGAVVVPGPVPGDRLKID